MSEALAAEWTKLRTLVGTWWLLAGTLAATVGGSAAIVAATRVSPGGDHALSQDPTRLALSGVALGQAVVAVLAVMVIGEEYATGMIRLTLSAIPRRRALLGAKAIALAGVTLLVALPAVAGCLVAGRALLPGTGLDPAHGYPLLSVADGPTLRAALGGVVYLALIALLSLGVAAVVRDTAAAAGVVLGLLYLPPLLAAVVSGPWQRHLHQLAPMSAGLAILATRNLSSLPVSPGRGLGTLAAWAAGAVVAGGVALLVRDA